jgi:hypothetical protein
MVSAITTTAAANGADRRHHLFSPMTTVLMVSLCFCLVVLLVIHGLFPFFPII